MHSILPQIPISALQRSAKKVLSGIQDYAIVQSHGRDCAFILHPEFGRILLQSGMFDALRQKVEKERTAGRSSESVAREMETLIGTVLRELSKK